MEIEHYPEHDGIQLISLSGESRERGQYRGGTLSSNEQVMADDYDDCFSQQIFLVFRNR